MEQTLLIIDDDCKLVTMLRKIMATTEMEIIHVFEYQSGSKVIARKNLLAVILDIMLPSIISGFEFLADLRATVQIPILATGRATAEDCVNAYHLGADIFMYKPLSPSELAAAILAQLRRYYELNRAAKIHYNEMALHRKGLMIDPRRRLVARRGHTVVLSPKEFDVLYFLASNPSIVLSQETIYKRVWGTEFSYGSRCVADHISSIRQKLSLSSDDGIKIETVYGIGYRFSI